VKSLVGSSFWGAFPSDSIYKVMIDVSAHFIIQSYTFGDELIMDNTLEIKNFSKLYMQIWELFEPTIYKGSSEMFQTGVAVSEDNKL
jgi:hypothetical protein